MDNNGDCYSTWTSCEFYGCDWQDHPNPDKKGWRYCPDCGQEYDNND